MKFCANQLSTAVNAKKSVMWICQRTPYFLLRIAQPGRISIFTAFNFTIEIQFQKAPWTHPISQLLDNTNPHPFLLQHTTLMQYTRVPKMTASQVLMPTEGAHPKAGLLHNTDPLAAPHYSTIQVPCQPLPS